MIWANKSEGIFVILFALECRAFRSKMDGFGDSLARRPRGEDQGLGVRLGPGRHWHGFCSGWRVGTSSNPCLCCRMGTSTLFNILGSHGVEVGGVATVKVTGIRNS